MRQILILLNITGVLFLTPGFLFAQINFDLADIHAVQDILTAKIDAAFINKRAIRYEDAQLKKSTTNQKFVQEHEQYKEILLDLTQQISRLNSEKETLETKKADFFTVLKNREAEVERIKKNIDAKNREVRDLETQISGIEKSGSETRNTIPFEGYFVTLVEGKQLSAAKDNLIEAAIDAISRLAIETLNGVAIESVSEVSDNVLIRDKIIMQISGRFTKDTASYKIDKFFNYKRTPVLIYGTKVSVHPFEMPEDIKAEKIEFKVFKYWHLKEPADFDQFSSYIKSAYPIEDSEISGWRANVSTVLEKILDHNKKSTESILDIVNSYQQSIDEKRERISQIKEELPNLKNLLTSAEQSYARQKTKFEPIATQTKETTKLLESKVAERDAHVKSQVFARAEIKDRKYRDPVKETKAIVKDILLELDKEFEQTGRSLTTTVNMGMYEGESKRKLLYKKRFIYGDIIPFYRESGEAIVGALVILRANFAAETVDFTGEPVEEPESIPDKIPGWLIAGAIGMMLCGLGYILFFVKRKPALPSKPKIQRKARKSKLDDREKPQPTDTKKAGDYCKQGDDWLKKGDYEKAIASYTKAIEHNRRDDAAYYNRGKAWHQKGDFQKAVEDYTKALEINPKRAEEPYVGTDSVWSKGSDDKV